MQLYIELSCELGVNRIRFQTPRSWIFIVSSSCIVLFSVTCGL